MTVTLGHRALVAKSHAQHVLGQLGVAYFHGAITRDKLDEVYRNIRVAYVDPASSPEAYEAFLFQIALAEEILVESLQALQERAR